MACVKFFWINCQKQEVFQKSFYDEGQRWYHTFRIYRKSWTYWNVLARLLNGEFKDKKIVILDQNKIIFLWLMIYTTTLFFFLPEFPEVWWGPGRLLWQHCWGWWTHWADRLWWPYLWWRTRNSSRSGHLSQWYQPPEHNPIFKMFSIYIKLYLTWYLIEMVLFKSLYLSQLSLFFHFLKIKS